MRLTRLLTLIAGVALTLSCNGGTSLTTPVVGGTGGGGNGGGDGASVSIVGDDPNFAFTPESLTVAVGTTVTWTNNSSVQHTTTSDDGLWNSPLLDIADPSNDTAAGTFQFTFNTPGTFRYHCSIHPPAAGFTSFVGVIVVTP